MFFRQQKDSVLAEITPGIRVGLITLTQWLLWALCFHVINRSNTVFFVLEASWIFVVRQAAAPTPDVGTVLLVLNPLMLKL